MTEVAEMVERVSVPELDEILGKQFKVLDEGFVRVVDYMGGDASIVQAARVSYGKGTKKVSEDRGLIRYLVRKRHCYTPEMQVLTTAGWKRWDECDYEETFLVPDPASRSLAPEKLSVEVFDATDEEMVSFENSRMSFCVTADHRMWFRGKYQDDFAITRAHEMPKWGHFDPLAGYTAEVAHDTATRASPLGELVGFILGDGSWSSGGVEFHLRKDRKKNYLRRVLSDLGIEPTERRSSTYKDAVVIRVGAEDIRQSGVDEYICVGDRAKDKSLENLDVTNHGFTAGVFAGLVNSDGHEKTDRDQIEFSSISESLLSAFEVLAATQGFDAHRVRGGNIGRVTAYPVGRTTLEARKKYFSTKIHNGKVYCATTSTGLLMVRGGPDKFGFVCGNTTPLEMCELKLHVRVPMDAWRQWIRHRMSSTNEYSTRYSIAIDACQQTDPHEWRFQSGSNKQGSGDLVDQITGAALSTREQALQQHAREVYEERIEAGVAREQARKDLPLSTYTEAYWKIDLHNLLHFLGLRMDAHAQKEIRDYADIIGHEIVSRWCPHAWEAFMDYHPHMGGMLLSKQEVFALGRMLWETGNAPIQQSSDVIAECLADSGSMDEGWCRRNDSGKLKRSRERDEFLAKLDILRRQGPVPR